MKKLFTLLAMAMIAIGANAQKLIAEKDFTGGFEGDYPYWYGGGGSVSSDADGIAITVNSPKEQLWLQTFPWNSLWLEKAANYKVVVTAKFPTNGTLMSFLDGSTDCGSSVYVTATGGFQEIEIGFRSLPDWFIDGDPCDLMFHFNDFPGTTILKKVQLYEIENAADKIDDITYIFNKERKTAEVAKIGEKCKTADIPASIYHEGEEYTVTKIMYHSFNECPYLTSVTIPNTVTEISPWAFSGCIGFEEITIPASVKVICANAFEGCWGLKRVIILADTPPILYDNSFLIDCNADPANGYNITLKVPDASIDAYNATAPWNKFREIEVLSKQKCEKPTISVEDGKLNFSCATEGVEYHYEISILVKGDGNGVKLPETLKVSVYASKDGFYDSAVETTEMPTVAIGDTNGDGVVNAADIVQIVDIIMSK